MEESNLLIQLGRHIRILRTMNELTQEKLAELADINITFLGHIERGSKNPTIETLYKIAKALNVTLPELVSFELDPDVPWNLSPDYKLDLILIEYSNKIRNLYKIDNKHYRK